MFCANCGNTINTGKKFCFKCGWQVPDSITASNKTPVETLDASSGDKKEEVVQAASGGVSKCNTCGKHIEDDWLVCPYCKNEIVRERICAHCGKKLESEWVVCPFCKTQA